MTILFAALIIGQGSSDTRRPRQVPLDLASASPFVLGQARTATAFFNAMRQGLYDLEKDKEPLELLEAETYDPGVPPLGKPRIEFDFPFGLVAFRPGDPRVWSAVQSEPISSIRYHKDHFTARRLTDEQAVAIARETYARAGYAERIEPFLITDRRGTNSLDIEIQYVPTASGVRYDRAYSGLINVDRLTGRVHSFRASRYSLPTPPQDLTPNFTPEQARFVALSHIAARYGGWLQCPNDYLSLSILSFNVEESGNRNGIELFFTEDDLARGRRGEARLMYGVEMWDETKGYWQLPGDVPVGSYVVQVDAESGRILATMSLADSGTGPGGIDSSLPPRPPFQPEWPKGARAWRYAAGAGAWKPAVRGAIRPTPVGAFSPTANVLLQSGPLAFRAAFDPGRGLLGVRVKKTLHLARPDAPLLAALRKLTKNGRR